MGADTTASGERSSLVIMYLHVQPFASGANHRSTTSSCRPGCPGIQDPEPSVVADSNTRLLHQSCSSPPKPCQMDQLSADRLPARLRLAIDNATFSTRHQCMPTVQSSQSNPMHLLMYLYPAPSLDNRHTQVYIHIYMRQHVSAPCAADTKQASPRQVL